MGREVLLCFFRPLGLLLYGRTRGCREQSWGPCLCYLILHYFLPGGKERRSDTFLPPRTFATRVFCLFVLLNSFIWLELVADFKEVKMAKVLIGLYFPGTLPRTRAGFASV